MANEVITEHTNSEGERVSIQRVVNGPFAGQLVLVIHDDPPLFKEAPMLLDQGTRDWLTRCLSGAVVYDGGHATFHDPIQDERAGLEPNREGRDGNHA